MEQIKRDTIQSVSRVLKIISLVLMFFLPIAASGVWIVIHHVPKSIIYHLFVVQEYALGPLTTPLGFSISIINSVALVLLFYHMFKLFSFYEKGEILSGEGVHELKDLSLIFFLQVLVNLIANRLYTMVLLFYVDPSDRYPFYGLTANEITLFICSFFLMFIGWIIDEARKVKDELSLVI